MRLGRFGEHFVLNMGVGHTEFFRSLPAAMGDVPFEIDRVCSTVHASLDTGTLTIRLAAEAERRIALLRVVNTDVEFHFAHVDAERIDAFMQHFLARYQRGGG